MEKDLNGTLYECCDELKGIVRHFYHIFSGAELVPVIKHLSPTLEIMMVFNFGDPVEVSFGDDPLNGEFIHRMAIIGPLRKMMNYRLSPGSDALVVNFELDGYYRFLKTSLAGVTSNFFHNLEELQLPVAADLDELWQQLAGMPDVHDRLNLLSDFIISHAAESEEAASSLVAGEAYFFDPLVNPVKALASDTDLTERSIQLRFQKYVGYSPKELIRFLRFKNMINHMLRLAPGKIDVFAIIIQFNYHDQSHLIKDFNFYLGTTPLKFINNLKGRQFCLSGQDKAVDDHR